MKHMHLSTLLGALGLCALLTAPAGAVLPLPAGVGPIDCKTMNAANIGVTADADGYTSISPFPPSGGVWTGTSGTVDLPDDGIICLKSIQSGSGTLKFNRNASNTPVYILVEDSVTMGSLVINVDGSPGTSITRIGMTFAGGLGGPGGSDGGSCDFVDSASLRAGEGLGPGGGRATFLSTRGGGGGASAIRNGLQGYNSGATGGTAYSQLDDRLLHGGSGGGCGNNGAGASATDGFGGAGGGGVLVMAAGDFIDTGSARFLARGGPACEAGGAGGGGVVRLVAPEIRGDGYIDVRGGAAGGSCPGGNATGDIGWNSTPGCATSTHYGGCGGTGLVKLEGYNIYGTFLEHTYRTQGEFAKDANPDLSLRFGTPQPIFIASSNIPRVEITNTRALFDATLQDQSPPTPDYSVHPYTQPSMYFRGGQEVTVTVETTHVPSDATVYLRMNAMDPSGAPSVIVPIVGDGNNGVGAGANPKAIPGQPTMFSWEGNVTVPAGAKIGDIEAWVSSVCTPGTTGCAPVNHGQ